MAGEREDGTDAAGAVPNPDEGTLTEILQTVRTIAVVGMSRHSEKDAHQVPIYLAEHGYTVWPVNPYADAIGGRTAYPDLAALVAAGHQPDAVLLFRPSEEVPQHREQLLMIEPAVVWMQVGIRHEPTAQALRERGIAVVQDRCMMTAHRFLIGA